MILCKKPYLKLDNGFISNTPFGDGWYNFIIGKKNNLVVQIIIFFPL